jgi:cyclopropane fatty-acyl-phospholipid synthase-like methyltransferase
MKPYAESCDHNQAQILEVLRDEFADRQQVLEIASGTGQHAVFLGRALAHLSWHTSELKQNHAGIQMWLDEARLPNVHAPIELDVNSAAWPIQWVDAIFNANTVHIVSWQGVENMFAGIGRALETGGIVCMYGAFNYKGSFTSESNARFDAWLRARDACSGVRDFEAVNCLAEAQGLRLLKDISMPGNNRTLVWKRG